MKHLCVKSRVIVRSRIIMPNCVEQKYILAQNIRHDCCENKLDTKKVKVRSPGAPD